MTITTTTMMLEEEEGKMPPTLRGRAWLHRGEREDNAHDFWTLLTGFMKFGTCKSRQTMEGRGSVFALL